MNEHEKINYIEFPSRDLSRSRAFFSSVFNWSFIDYGTEYIAFSNAGLDGGFFKTDAAVSIASGSPLVVFYSHNLQTTQDKICNAGGSITKPVFAFPGGHRFHFHDTNGNEYAVWSDTEVPDRS